MMVITIDNAAKQRFLDKYLVLAYWKTEANLTLWQATPYASDLKEKIWDLIFDDLLYVPAGPGRKAYYKFKNGINS